MKKKTKIIVAVCMAVVLVVCGVYVYGRVAGDGADESTEVAQTTAVAVEAGNPEVGELAVTGTYIGTVSPQEQVSVIPLVSGEVTEVNFEVGDYVEAGSVLVRIDDEAAQIQLQSAQLNKEAAQLSAERTLGSTQYSSNLSMVSSIQSIENQIEMAQKQYNAAGDSVADAKEAKEDLQDALDSINSNISKMESNYSSMKSMAASAKQLVKQDVYGNWQWKVDLLKDELETVKGYSGEAYPGVSESNIIQTPSSDSFVQNESSVENESQAESQPSGEEESQTQNESPSQPESQTQNESTAQPESQAQNESSTQPESQAQNESPSQPESQSDSSDEENENDKDTNDTAAAGHRIVAVSAGREEMRTLSMEEIRSHRNPRKAEELTSLTVSSGSGDYAVIAVSDNSAQIAALEAQIAALEPATQKMIAAGYSAADIGEGRMDDDVSSYASSIASLKSQAATLQSNIKSMDSTISQAEVSQDTTADTIDMYKDNLKVAQTQYAHQNGQAYADNAAALQNQIDSTEIGIASAQMQLENYTLTAPISGYIEQKNVDDYGMVSAGNPVYVISNKDSMTVTFYVSEAVKNQLTVGQTLSLERSGQTASAAITQIGQSVDSRTGLFEVKASTTDGNLANGVTVQIHVDTAKVSDAILIPYDAVYFEGENAYVYCVDGDVLVKTQVTTGLSSEDTIEIISGLTKDSVVVHTWSPQLSDGVKVRLIEE